MPSKPKPQAGGRGSSTVALLTEWVRQGTESFFATQRILLDLVMRQNANALSAVRERLEGARSVPAAALTEIAGEGISNFIAAQRVLLQLAQRQNEIVMGGVAERAGGVPPAAALAGLLRRGVDTFIDMQQHFLSLAAKQADVWVESAREGRAFEGRRLAELGRDAMENFVRSQKKFLDAVAEETAHATGAHNGRQAPARKAEIAEMAREGVEAFLDAQKKLLDIAAQQMAVQVRTARRAVESINPLPPAAVADLTRRTVDSFVAAQKALLDVMARPAGKPQPAEKPKAPPRRTVRKRTTPQAAAVTA